MMRVSARPKLDPVDGKTLRDSRATATVKRKDRAPVVIGVGKRTRSQPPFAPQWRAENQWPLANHVDLRSFDNILVVACAHDSGFEEQAVAENPRDISLL